MKIVFRAVALVIGAVALVIGVGALLPATREGRAEAVIAAPPSAILSVIADVERQPEWREGLRGVERTGTGWVETAARGERITFAAPEMTEERIALTFTSDAGYSGEWTATLTPEGAGTRIAVTERATIPSPFGRILARMFFDPRGFSRTYLAALKARVEG